MNNKWLVFIGASLMVFLVNVDSTIVNLALVSISKDLHSNLSQIQWIVNSYLLTTIIFFIIGGKLSDILGRKRIFLIGTLLFAFSSLAAGLASDFSLLVIARLVQGVGFAFTLGLALLMISISFPVQQRGFVLGLIITIASIGQTVGPTLGGILIQELNWHWIFLINLPIALISFMLTYFYAPDTVPAKKDHPIDYTGTLLFSIALSILLLTFNLLSGIEINFQLFAFGIVTSVLIFFLFYWKEARTAAPLIDFTLFANRDYTLTICIRALFMYLFGTFLFFIPIYLQNILSFSPVFAGLILLVYSSFFGICSPMAGIWCDYSGYRGPIIFAGLASIIAFLILTIVHTEAHFYSILFAMGCFGLSAGIMMPSTVDATIATLPKQSVGEGIGMFFTLAFMGMSLGVAISGAQVNLISTHRMEIKAPQIKTSLSHADQLIVHRVANGSQPSERLKTIFTNPNQFKVIDTLAKESFVDALAVVMWTNAIIAFVITVLAIALKKNKHQLSLLEKEYEEMA